MVLEGLMARPRQTLGNLAAASSERSGNLEVAELPLVKMYTDAS
jgi:hypothetical protein